MDTDSDRVADGGGGGSCVGGGFKVYRQIYSPYCLPHFFYCNLVPNANYTESWGVSRIGGDGGIRSNSTIVSMFGGDHHSHQWETPSFKKISRRQPFQIEIKVMTKIS